MARLRSSGLGSPDYWEARIKGYLSATINPQQALPERVIYVAADHGEVIGLIAGHRTTRYGCEGELQWIDVLLSRRREGVGEMLVTTLARWFNARGASRICVDVDPSNAVARKFYENLGAIPLNAHWMHWPHIGKLLERE